MGIKAGIEVNGKYRGMIGAAASQPYLRGNRHLSSNIYTQVNPWQYAVLETLSDKKTVGGPMVGHDG